MRLGNLAGRLVVERDGAVVDVERASRGRFGADPQLVYEHWEELVDWAGGIDHASHASPAGTGGTEPFPPSDLGPPAPRPRQIFAVALNYRDHAAETGAVAPDQPSVFTKFVSAMTGPYGDITLPEGDVDWEVELVAVIGRPASQVPESDAWEHVAGLTVGQDLSERRRQLAGPTPQFSLAKSFPGFAPMGPWLVTPDELDDPDDVELGCQVNGEKVQQSRTSQLIFPVPALVSRLSMILPLLPGDVIFTGTPAGVGIGRNPPRFLSPGDELVTYAAGIGEMRHHLVE